MGLSLESVKQQWFAPLKEGLETLGLALRWGGVVVGGLSLLVYTKEIRRFPAGIGVGEGLALYLVSVAFLLYYFVYWMAVSALSSVAMRGPVELLLALDRRRRRRKNVHHGIPFNTSLAAMTGSEVVGFALFGGLLYAIVVYQARAPWLAAVLPPILQGALIAMWLILGRRSEFDAVGLALPTSEPIEQAKGRSARGLARRGIAFLIVAAPWFTMPNNDDAVRQAFEGAQLRKRGATVHVQQPWAALLPTEVGEVSPLGPTYLRFRCVDVLLYGIGDNVVIDRASLHASPSEQQTCEPTHHWEAKGPAPLTLPAHAVWVE